jgi:hypothetical protein
MSEQQSNKRGARSDAQKTDDAKHDFDPMPATKPVAGASGLTVKNNCDFCHILRNL